MKGSAPENMKITEKAWEESKKRKLLLKKGIYLYEYMVSALKDSMTSRQSSRPRIVLLEAGCRGISKPVGRQRLVSFLLVEHKLNPYSRGLFLAAVEAFQARPFG